MRFEYGLIGVMAALVLGILGMIAIGPDEIAVPKIESDAREETLLPIAEETPELEPELEPIEEPVSSMLPPKVEEVQDIGVQEEIEVDITPKEPQPIEPTSETEELLHFVEVKIAVGSGVPGCEETNECYNPYEVKISAGGEITWHNVDTAAHTVTSGTPGDGPDGEFDSSLFMAGNSFSHTFDSAGTYNYFCMVHPWMTGIVQVS